MPAALPTNRAEEDPGHVNDTNTMHEFRNRVVSVGRSVIYVDAVNGNDANDGFSLAYPKQTLAGAEAIAVNGNELRFVNGAYNMTSGVTFTDKRGIRLLGEGGNSRNSHLGTRFRATANGINLLTFVGTDNIITEGPEIANISFIDASPTGKTAKLLTLTKVNRWQIQRCDFWNADVGLTLNSAGGDNAWNVITGATHFSHCRIGLDSQSGAGFRDFGSEFTACTEYSVDCGAQSNKFFGTFFDGNGTGGINIKGNHHVFAFCKFEGVYHPTTKIAIHVRSNPDDFAIGNQNQIIGGGFAGYGSQDAPDAYIHIEDRCRGTVVVFNRWVQQSHLNRIVDLGQITIKWNPQETQTYAASNTTTTRSFNTNSTTTDELADVVGTLIADLRDIGIVQ